MKTDTQLQRDVLDELQWVPAIHATTIGVEVKDGVVTLVGNVGSSPEKWEAGRAVQRVSGARALAVDLEVEVTGPDVHSDSDIARASAQVLACMSFDPEGAVKILVEDGWIELVGELEWNLHRTAVEDGLRHIPGVKGINNYTTLSPKLSSSAVRSDIEAALKRRVVSEAHRISVDVQGTEVTLSGRVGSWGGAQYGAGCSLGNSGCAERHRPHHRRHVKFATAQTPRP